MRRLFPVMLSFALLGAPHARGQTAAARNEQACQEHLRVLGLALVRYLLDHAGQPPAQLSQLQSSGYVLDLDTFVCPASSNRLVSAQDIDARSDYALVHQITPERPLLLVRDKAGFHEGIAWGFYSDRSFKKIPVAPPTSSTPAPLVVVTNRTTTSGSSTTVSLSIFGVSPSPGMLEYLRGLALVQQKQFTEAEAAMRAAIQAAPTNALFHAGLGYVLAQQPKWAESETSFREAARLDPNNGQYAAWLGNVLVAQNRWIEAEAPYRNAARLEARNGYAREGIGHSLMAQNRFAEAEAAFRDAIRVDARIGSFHAGLAGALYRLGRIPDATASAQEALRLGFRDHWVIKQLGLAAP